MKIKSLKVNKFEVSTKYSDGTGMKQTTVVTTPPPPTNTQAVKLK